MTEKLSPGFRVSRREFTRTAAAGAAAAAGCAGSLKPPNLLFIFPDQFRVQSLGFMGEDPVRTPYLDRLAAQSVVFNNAVATFPLCTPYRGMLMTGRYPWKTGLLTNCNTWSRQYGVFLKETERCLTDILHEASYETGYLGKWHLDAPADGPDVDDWRQAEWDAYTPPGPRRHGIGYWYSYGCYNNHLQPHYWTGGDREPREVQTWSPEHETDKAIEYLKNRDTGAPFALFLSMNPPHPPYHLVPERYRDLYQQAGIQELLNRPNVRLEGRGAQAADAVRDYFSAVTGVDEQIGRLLQCLNAEGLADNTIVVVTSDHGELMGSHALMAKTWYYDESFRVPLLLRWPAAVQPAVEPMPIGTIDLMPTLLGLLGLERTIPALARGRNLSTVLAGQSVERPEYALYMSMSVDPSRGRRGLRSERYTFCLSKDGEAPVLFDNLNDPYQVRNIAEEQSALTDELAGELRLALTALEDPWMGG